ncbi:hypothetical protein DH2020_014834 [Rehmannia glutinosa]|uniref:ENTH domain-containing protein n=1 Tax=Rehmannia glutinosa TaxID=99300 RepID=A0ABR0WYG0_REHGL
MESFRKAYGALKDSTKVGLAKVNSEFKVAIKVLIVFHRILREGDPSFREELMHFTRRGHIFEISNFKDDSGPLDSFDAAWDCSAWIRTYALYLEERVECFRNLNFDIESDRAPKSPSGVPKEIKLPSLQQLLYRLICCQPEGTARHNFLVQYALALFFEMPKHEAVRALDIYKKAGRQADHLADFYGFCRTLDLAQTFQFPTLRQPPPSFLATMEDYIKEAPQAGSVSKRRQPKEVNPPLISAEEPIDLLGLNEVNQKAGQLEESNALALAIVQPGNDAPPFNSGLDEIGKTSGWELALVTAPSNINKPQVAETKMGGGFNKSLLDSLYEDDVARRQLQLHSAGYNTTYGYETSTPQNLFDQRGPYAMPNNVVPPTGAQMAMMSHHQQMAMQQQQQMMMQQQNMMMMMMVPHNSTPYTAQYPQHQMPQMGSSNPFGDPFGYPQSAMPPHGNHTLL